jgi:hypothetical protein
MTLLTPEKLDPTVEQPLLETEPDSSDTSAPVAGAPTDIEVDAPIRAGFTWAAALLTATAAAWLAGSLFQDPWLPRLLAVGGGLLGVCIVGAASRGSRGAALAYFVVPAAAIAGAVATAPVARGGTSNLPNLVREALATGGLLHAPLPFDPGWRFLLVVTYAVLGAAALGLALARNRATLAVIVPLPFVVGGALLQPPGLEVQSSSVAVALVVGALALCQGASIAAGTELGSAFELRRLARGVGILVVLLAAIAALSHADFLFPATKKDQIIPPRKPPVVPLGKDRELFQVQALQPGPWRVGALDSFDGAFWLLPAFDPTAQVEVKEGKLPEAPTVPATERSTFVVRDLSGRNLPIPGGAARLSGTGATVVVDPATGVPALKTRVQPGFRYVIESEPAPSAASLAVAPPAPADFTQRYTALPPAPPAVQKLVGGAPPGAFDRLAYLRAALYKNVIAKGSGQPIGITPDRVAAMLKPDTTATPYEIVAAEAMLARWAGVPARIGFGYYSGDVTSTGSYSVHPRNGAAWLEAYFTGHGWVPLVGTPPRAEGSSSSQQKQNRPDVQQSKRSGVAIFTLVKTPSLRFLFDLIRFWAAIAAAIATGLLLLFAVWPMLCKWRRSSRRHAWGQRYGPRAAALAAYAELRDRCHDLHLGDQSDTPLEFVGRFEPDAEHAELAWLMTRLLWGDLRRDARAVDASEAESMTQSVMRRIAQEQPPINNVLGRLARASLREPWNAETPNFWPVLRVRRALAALRRGVTAPWRVLRVAVLRRPVPVAPAVLVVVALLAGCGSNDAKIAYGPKRPVAKPLDRIVPEKGSLAGLTFTREAKAEQIIAKAGSQSLVSQGRVWAMRSGSILQGTVQELVLKPNEVKHPLEAMDKLTSSIGSFGAALRFGPYQVLRIKRLGDVVYIWIPPNRDSFVLYVFRKEYEAPQTALRALLGYATGFTLTSVPEPTEPTPTASPAAAVTLQPTESPTAEATP